MNKVLLITSVYRVGERIYPIIPKLSSFCDIDLLCINEMSPSATWYGDIDPRINFNEQYKKYITQTFNVRDGFKTSPLIDTSEYDLIIYDDDRVRYGLDLLYINTKCPVIGSLHGGGIGYGRERYDKGYNKVFDYLMVFGDKDVKLHPDANLIKIGIPSNDVLINYQRSDEHILCIVNFLGNFVGYDKCPVKVDENYIKKVGVLELQQEFHKNVIFKLKSRHALPDYEKDLHYLQSIIPKKLEYNIIVDHKDNDDLIAQSSIVITPASTLAFKSIQLGIPTILIEDAGITGHFYDYQGMVKLDTQQIFDEIERQYITGKDINFIRNTIEGGIDFTSTEKCIQGIQKVLE